jgi:hypothetical protein
MHLGGFFARTQLLTHFFRFTSHCLPQLHNRLRREIASLSFKTKKFRFCVRKNLGLRNCKTKNTRTNSIHCMIHYYSKSNYAYIANQSEEQIAAAFLHLIFTILNLQF